MTIPHKVYNGSKLPDTPGHFECSECGRYVKDDSAWCPYCRAIFGMPKSSGILEGMKTRHAKEIQEVPWEQ